MRSEEIAAPWWRGLAIYTEKPVLRMLFFGFSSGLPLLLVFGTLSYWLAEADVKRSTIGFISWVALAYGFKWVWSPLVDRLPLPILTRALGRRRAWLLLAQLCVAGGLLGMALTDPVVNLTLLVVFAAFVAFSSATQDIVVDAYRIETGDPRRQGAMAAAYTIGYRLAMIAAGAGALWIAAAVDPDESTYQYQPWLWAYASMAALMLVGLLTTLLSPEPDRPSDAGVREREARGEAWLSGLQGVPGPILDLLNWIWRAVISPFVDFVSRYRWQALLLLALIGTYRISDIVLGVMANVFYNDMGFTKDEVAFAAKTFGVILTMVGTAIGGVLVFRLGVLRVLFWGEVLVVVTNLMFAYLATQGNDFALLLLVVGLDNLSAGIATAAFIAYLSSLTNVAYSATQYALFSSMMLLFPKFIGGFSGVMVESFGYPMFFTLAATLGLPVLILIWLAKRYTQVKEPVGAGT